MNQLQAAVVAQLQAVKRVDGLLARCTRSQQKFIRDPSRRKAALCARRAGKSEAVATYLLAEACLNPGVTCVYIGLSRGSAKDAVWKKLLGLNEQFLLGGKANKSELSLTFINESVIVLTGEDTSAAKKERLRGGAFRLAIIDECGSFTTDLKELSKDVLGPMMWDEAGTICMTSTPGKIKDFFWEVTSGKQPGWSVHSWSILENPNATVVAEYQRDLAEEISLDPGFLSTPRGQREFLGKWPDDSEGLVYCYDPQKNAVLGLPKLQDNDWWTFVMGVDFGFTDAAAFVVCCFNQTDPCFYVIHASKQPGLDVTGTCEKIRELNAEYMCRQVVCDGARPDIIAELNNRHNINAEATLPKQDKAEHVDLLNADMRRSRIKLLKGECKLLVEEMQKLPWDEKALRLARRRTEDSRFPNHLCDAFLYVWYQCGMQYLSSPKNVEKPETEPERMFRITQERMQQRLEEEKESGFSMQPTGDPWR